MTLVPMSIVLLITTAGLVPNVKATRPLTRGEPQIWDEFDLAKTNGQLLRDWEDPALFQLDPDQDPNNFEPGDLIAFDPEFPRSPLILKKALSSNEDDDDEGLNLVDKMYSMPKRGRTMGAHRFVRLYHHQPRPQRRYIF